MNNKIGVFSSSLTFIGLGVLLLANNFYDFHMLEALSALFAIILIVIGLEFLLYSYRHKDSESPVRLNGKSIFAIIMAAIISFSIVGISEVFEFIGNWGINFGNSFSIDMNADPVATHQITKNYDATDLQVIDLKNYYGDVAVYGEERNDVEIAITINEYSEERIDETLLQELKDTDDNAYFNINEISNTLNIKTIENYPKNNFLNRPQHYGFYIDYTIKCPIDMKTEVNNKYGEVQVTDLNKDVSVHNAYGDVKVSDIQANVDIINSYDEVKVKNITGNVTVDMEYDSVFISDIDGSLNIGNKYGLLKVENITGSADLKNSYDEIDLTNIEKATLVEAEYADLRVNNIEDITVKSSYTDIHYYANDIMAKNIDIVDKYGNILLVLPENQEGDFNLTTSYGDINNAFNMPLKEENVTQQIQHNIGETNNSIRIDNKYSDITIDKKDAVVIS